MLGLQSLLGQDSDRSEAPLISTPSFKRPSLDTDVALRLFNGDDVGIAA